MKKKTLLHQELCSGVELKSLSDNISWSKIDKLNATPYEEFNYTAQKRNPSETNKARSSQKLRRNSIDYAFTNACPFYPYATGGRIAKWNCEYFKTQEILQNAPVMNGCTINLESSVLPSQFLRALHNKTLWIMGESLSVEIFIALACRIYRKSDLRFHTVGDSSLHKVEDKQLKNHWGKLHTKEDMRGIHCIKINEGDFNARICLNRIHKYPFEFGHFDTENKYERSLRHFREFALLTNPSDILLFGFGIAINSRRVESGKWSYEKQVSLFLKWYHENVATFPRLIWREIPAQHFNSKTGMYSKYEVGNACINLPLLNDKMISEANWRNVIADSIAATYKIPVLKVWLLSAARADAHVGNDCTHYCLPGLPDIWVILLMQMVRDL